ncbi:hypothetical protein ACQP3C_30625, partial [Escherichia coli]
SYGWFVSCGVGTGKHKGPLQGPLDLSSPVLNFKVFCLLVFNREEASFLSVSKDNFTHEFFWCLDGFIYCM